MKSLLDLQTFQIIFKTIALWTFWHIFVKTICSISLYEIYNVSMTQCGILYVAFLGLFPMLYCVPGSEEEGLLRSFRLIEQLQSSSKEIDCWLLKDLLEIFLVIKTTLSSFMNFHSLQWYPGGFKYHQYSSVWSHTSEFWHTEKSLKKANCCS